MLLDEPPNDLIHKCTQSFHIDPDKLSLARIQDSISTLQSSRTHRLHSQRTTLKSLSRQLSTLQSTHALTLQTHNPAEHAAEILRLDTEKFRVAKEASGLEMEGERLEGEMERVKGVLEEVEGQGVEGGEAVRRVEGMEDEILLKLKIYRMLGIEIEPDADTGLYKKAAVRNAQRDARVIQVDPKSSRFFYANLFWDSM